MNGKDLFDVINEIDDKYIEEAKETSGAAVENVTPNEATPSAPKALPVKPDRSRLKRNILSVTMAIAALGLMTIGLWKAGLFGGKKDLIEKQSTDIVISSGDLTDPDPTTAVTTIPFASVQASDDETITPTEVPTTPTDPTTTHTEATDFHGDCLISATVPSDGMIEKEGKTVPSVLELTITNESDSPLYIEEAVTLQKQGADGEWEDAVRIGDETMLFEDRVVPAGETAVIRFGILTEHYELWSGPARVILNVHFYESDPDDPTQIEHETALYMKAADFDL